MKNSIEKNIQAIKAIDDTLNTLDINYHKQLIDLLNEYKTKLNTKYNCLPIINSLVNEMSLCILENNLKVPPEVNKLIQTLSSLNTKFMLNFGI